MSTANQAKLTRQNFLACDSGPKLHEESLESLKEKFDKPVKKQGAKSTKTPSVPEPKMEPSTCVYCGKVSRYNFFAWYELEDGSIGSTCSKVCDTAYGSKLEAKKEEEYQRYLKKFKLN